MNEEYIANAERRRKIADDMAWSSGYAAGRAADRARHAALVGAARDVVADFLQRPASLAAHHVHSLDALREALVALSDGGES